MKFITSLFWFVALLSAVPASRAAEDPFIPPSLNALLPKITSGMTHEEMKKVLAGAYPKLEQQDGPWSGAGAYIGFKLDDRYSLMFSAKMNASQQPVVSSNAQISVFDRLQKRRLDITSHSWEQASKESSVAEFERWYAAWHQECQTIRSSSNTYDYIGLPSYRKIVAIGKPALPSLERKMAENQGLDFMLAFAAVEICGWDRQEFRGGSEQDFRDRVLRKLRQQ